MRLQILSDLHLRHHDSPSLDALRAPGADMVILAGDIHAGVQGIEWARTAFPETPVAYVPGNHEYYDHFLDATRPALRAAGDDPDRSSVGSDRSSVGSDRSSIRSGVYVMDRDAVTIGDLRVLGCTLWTGFRLFDGQRAQAMRACRADVDDYRRIHLLRARRALRPRDTDRIHRSSVRWLRRQLATDPPGVRATVIVTHHPPSRRSVDPRYAGTLTSAAFVARQGRLVAQSGAAAWVHGHVHATFDYRLGGTRVVSNPRGHGDEAASFQADRTVTV